MVLTVNKIKKYGVYGGLFLGGSVVVYGVYKLFNLMSPSNSETAPATATATAPPNAQASTNYMGGSKKTRRHRGDKPNKHTKSKKH